MENLAMWTETVDVVEIVVNLVVIILVPLLVSLLSGAGILKLARVVARELRGYVDEPTDEIIIDLANITGKPADELVAAIQRVIDEFVNAPTPESGPVGDDAVPAG